MFPFLIEAVVEMLFMARWQSGRVAGSRAAELKVAEWQKWAWTILSVYDPYSILWSIIPPAQRSRLTNGDFRYNAWGYEDEDHFRRLNLNTQYMSVRAMTTP